MADGQVDELLRLVSPRVGIIREVTRAARGAREPCPPTLYHAVLSDFDFRKGTATERMSAGKGLDDREAIGGAIGEALERYCASHVDPAIITRTVGVPPEGAIPPQEFVLFSDGQYARPGFPHVRPGPSTEIDWIAACEAGTDRRTLVPASLVYLHGDRVLPGDALCAATSNGMAAGPDLPSAVASGLCELIERDAFLITWMNRLPAPELDLSRLDGPPGEICDHYRRFGLETRVFNLTTDIPISVMMAVSVDRSAGGRAAVVGLGCHPSPGRALLKALFEVCQVRPGADSRSAAEARPLRYEDVRTMEDHSALFAPIEMLPELAFLLDGTPRQTLESLSDASSSSPGGNLHAIVGALRQAGSRAFYVDLTTSDLADYPVRVVRTLATGLQPMHFGHRQERLGGKRLFAVPRILGYHDTDVDETGLNPCPHPLA